MLGITKGFSLVLSVCLGFLLPPIPKNSIFYFLATAEATTLVNIPMFSQKKNLLVLLHCLVTSIPSVQSAGFVFSVWNYSTTPQHHPTSSRHFSLGFSFNKGGLRNKNLRRLLFTLTMYMLTWELCKIDKYNLVLHFWHDTCNFYGLFSLKHWY